MKRADRPRSAAARAVLAALALGVAATPSPASPELARQHGCMGCHAVNGKVVGPAFTDVAKRYAGNPAAAKTVATNILAGSKGAWGEVMMPAQPQLSVPDADVLAQWVLRAGR